MDPVIGFTQALPCNYGHGLGLRAHDLARFSPTSLSRVERWSPSLSTNLIENARKRKKMLTDEMFGDHSM